MSGPSFLVQKKWKTEPSPVSLPRGVIVSQGRAQMRSHVSFSESFQADAAPNPQSPLLTRLGGGGGRLQVVTGTDSGSGSHAGLWICWKKRDRVIPVMPEKNPSPLASDFLFASTWAASP